MIIDATTDATSLVELPIEQAADRLGISVDALRLRVRRGKTIRGHKRHGQWYVFLPADATDHDHDATPRDRDATADVNGRAHGHDHDATSAVYDRLVAAKEQEIARLVEQIHVKDQQLQQANVIIAQLTQRVAELPAPTPVRSQPDATTTHPEPPEPTPARRWWRFW